LYLEKRLADANKAAAEAEKAAAEATAMAEQEKKDLNQQTNNY